jgi:error-prone DNA polymerase
VLARGEEGYHRSAAITGAAARGEKGRPFYDLESLANRAGGTGRSSPDAAREASAALEREGPEGAERALLTLVDLFGADRVAVELIDHGDPLDSRRNDALAALAAPLRLPVVATNNVHYAAPERAQLARRSPRCAPPAACDELEGGCPRMAAHLRSGAEMTARFARYPGAIAAGLEIAEACAFPLRRAKPALPTMRVPEGETPMSHCGRWSGRRCPRPTPTAPEELTDEEARIERELGVIEQKDFPGYFLIVHGIVKRRGSRHPLPGPGIGGGERGLLPARHHRGRSIFYNLPFERFLATTRRRSPTSTSTSTPGAARRSSSGSSTSTAENAAQVANVIQYRPKNAVRDMAKALGHSRASRTPGRSRWSAGGWI